MLTLCALLSVDKQVWLSLSADSRSHVVIIIIIVTVYEDTMTDMEDNNTHFDHFEDYYMFDDELLFRVPHKVKMVFCLVVMLLFIVGIVFNALCIRVFGRDQSTNHTTRFLLQMLSVAELISIVLICVVDFLNLPFIYLEIYARPTGTIALTATSWLVVLVTFDHYAILYRPQLAAKYSTLPRVKIAVCVVWVASAVFNLPQFFEFSIVIQPSGDHYIDATPLLTSEAYIIAYLMCFKLLVVRLLPLSLNIFFTRRLVHHVRRTGNEDRRDVVVVSYTTLTDVDRQLTRALCMFVAVFDVFQVVFIAVSLFSYTLVHDAWFSETPSHAHVYHSWEYVYMIANVLLVVSLSIKLMIFSAASPSFRRTLNDICRCRCRCRRSTSFAGERIDGGFSPVDVSFHGDTVTLPQDLPLVVSE